MSVGEVLTGENDDENTFNHGCGSSSLKPGYAHFLTISTSPYLSSGPGSLTADTVTFPHIP